MMLSNIPLAPSLEMRDKSIKWVPMTSSDTESLKAQKKGMSQLLYLQVRLQDQLNTTDVSSKFFLLLFLNQSLLCGGSNTQVTGQVRSMVLNKDYYGSTHKYKSSLHLPSEHKAKSHRPDLTWTMTCVLDLPPIMSVCDLRFEQVIPLIDWQTGWLTG